METDRPLPICSIALGLTLAVATFSLVISYLDWSRNPDFFGYGWLLDSWLEGNAIMLPPMLLVGVPLGWLWLREPGADFGRWAGTGIAAALVGAMVFYASRVVEYGADALLVAESWGVALLCIPTGLVIGALAWPASHLIARVAQMITSRLKRP